MRACALQELGRHDESIAIAQALRRDPSNSDVRLAGEMIELLVLGCKGDYARARIGLQLI